MNSVPRKLTLGLILAIGAAACGDDVTVEEVQPVTPTPVVRSVVVSPATATIAPGGSFTFGAAVDADAGLARTVTWSSSNTNVATVTAAGVASAPASLTTGGVTSVCAVSTADADVKSCAQLTVSPAQNSTIQIDAVTRDCDPLNIAVFGGAAACGLQVPVIENNVVGQITVSALINRPAGAGATNVVFQVLDGAGVVLDSYTQVVTADLVASSELAAQQTVNNRVTQSINTARYDLSGAGGSAKVYMTNGARQIKVCLSPTAQSCTGAGQTAVALKTVTFNNANGFHVTVTTALSSGNNANGVAVRQSGNNAPTGGLFFNGGTAIALQAVPVSYTGSGAVVVSANTNLLFGQGCDLALGNRAVAAAVSANGVMTGTLAYTNGGALGAGNVNAYEMNPACGAALFGEVPGATAEINGNPFINFVLGGNFGANNTLNNPITPVVPGLGTATAIRLDNRGPSSAGMVITATPTSRALGWMNDAVVLNATTAANAANGVITTAPTDLGIGGTVVFAAHAGLVATCATVATCQAITPTVTSLSGFAETLTPTEIGVVDEATDLFGNRVNSNRIVVGRDNTAPLAAANGAVTADASVVDLSAAITPPSVNFSDLLAGFAGAGAVSESFIRVNGAVGGLTRTNILGTGAISATPFATTGTAAAPTATFVNTPAVAAYAAAPTVITRAAIAQPVNAGYYIYQARARDQAGNTGAMFVRRYYVNNAGIPVITGLNSSLTYTGGIAAAFPATAADSTEVSTGELRLAYPNIGGAGDLVYSRPSPTVDPTFDDNAPIPSSVPFSVSAFIRGIQGVTGAGAPDVATFATVKPTAARGRAYNPFGSGIGLFSTGNPEAVTAGVSGVSGDFSAPILSAQITGNTDYSTQPAATLIASWLTTTSATVPAATCAAIASGLRTCTFTVTARGPTGTFVNPFTGGLALVESFDAAGPTGNWRVISGPGAVSLGAAASASITGVNVTITPCSTAPFPCLDNGVNRDYTWTVSITRQSAAAVAPNTAIKWYRVVGLNTGFDGLASIPLSINFVTGAIAP